MGAFKIKSRKRILIHYKIIVNKPLKRLSLILDGQNKLLECNESNSFYEGSFVFVCRYSSGYFSAELIGTTDDSGSVSGTIFLVNNGNLLLNELLEEEPIDNEFKIEFEKIVLDSTFIIEKKWAPERNFQKEFDLEVMSTESDSDGVSGGGYVPKYIPTIVKNTEKSISSKKDPGGTVTLFFGTCRNRTEANDVNEYFGSNLSDLQLGNCTISIPPGRAQGEMNRPRKILWYELKESKEEHIILSTIKDYEENNFYKWLKDSLNECADKSALLFIHGYNNSFADAARRTGQIVYDLPFNGISGFFSWPSSGEKESYLEDVEKADASISLLKKFIEDFIVNTGVKHIHFIAHSMGNRVLTQALNNLATKDSFKSGLQSISQIILAAADIDVDVFKNTIYPAFRNTGLQRTLYTSDKDLALWVSQKLRGSRPRLGDAGDSIFLADGIDTIDASNVESSGIHHGYIFETKELLYDLYLLLSMGLNPSSRRLREVEKNKFKYWLFMD